jgi:hypothetical protein
VRSQVRATFGAITKDARGIWGARGDECEPETLSFGIGALDALFFSPIGICADILRIQLDGLLDSGV